MSPITPLQVIGLAKESVFGTFVAPTNFVPGTCQPNTTQKHVQPAQSRGTRGQVVNVRVGHEAGATVNAELIPEVLSLPIAGWFGTSGDALTGSAGAGYTHTLTPQNALPSFSLELDTDVVSQLLARQIVGNVADQVQIKATQQALATVQLTLLGQRETTPATPGLPSNPTPAISTLQPLDFSLLASTIDGAASTQLQDITLTLANAAQRVFSSNGQLYCARIVPGRRKVTLSTLLDFLDTSFYTRWSAATKSSGGGLVFSLTTAQNIAGATNPYLVQFTIPGVTPQNQFNMGNASDVVNQTIDWVCTVQGSNEVSAVIRNSESSALV